MAFFFEAGQFEAKKVLFSNGRLAGSSDDPVNSRDPSMKFEVQDSGQTEIRFSDKLVCLFDVKIPSPFSKYNGTKVEAFDRFGRPIDMTAEPSGNLQLEETSSFALLERMLKSTGRDTNPKDERRRLREKAHALITAFLGAGRESAVEDHPLQPRISFILPPRGQLSRDTIITGWDKSLTQLFSITSETTTWQNICACVSRGGVLDAKNVPLWISDIEQAAALIASNFLPDRVDHKCRLKGRFYRVFPARYEDLKSGSKRVFVSFLPSSIRPFDLRERISTLLSGLILSIRFRERLIPKALGLRNLADTDKKAGVMDFYRELLAVETESAELGLAINDDDVPEAETPLLSAFRDGEVKNELEAEIRKWHADRLTIEKLISDFCSNRDTVDEVIDKLNSIFLGRQSINSLFVTAIIDELKYVSHIDIREAESDFLVEKMGKKHVR